MAGEPQELRSWTVEAADTGRRLDLYLTMRLGDLSRSKVQRLIEREAVTLNGAPAKARTLVSAGDVVAVTLLPDPPSPLQPVAWPLTILFEDEHVIVVDKPAGLAVHPGAGETPVTLVQALLHHAGTLAEGDSEDAALRPGIVHRLDKDTSGVMVCAKTERAMRSLSRQFHDKRDILREYVALLDGIMSQAEIAHESFLYRDPAARVRFASLSLTEAARRFEGGTPPKGYRYAKSIFRRAAEYASRLTLVRVRLFTGRTHQIRVHAKDLGFPIVGDPVYHRPIQLPRRLPEDLRAQLARLGRQMLHAKLLGFRHPESGEALLFEADYPKDFRDVLQALAPYRSDGGELVVP